MSPLLDLIIRAVIVLTLTWIAVAAMRRRPASLRGFIWTIGIAGTLALPLAAQVVPAWTIEMWEPPAAPAAIEVREPARASAPTDAELPMTDDGRDERVAEHAAPTVASMSALSASPAASPTDRSPIVLFFWAVLTSVLLARIAASHARMNALLAEAGPAGADWDTLVAQLRVSRGIRRAVNVRSTDAISVPAIVGVIKPTLLLPSDASAWDDDTRRAVVLHELAHVARWDAFAQLIGQIACAIYWFIPLAWYGAHRASALRERASDDEVLQAGVKPSTYADRLLSLARGAGAIDLQLAAVAMARPSRMRERVMAILDPSARRHRLTARKVAVAAIVCTSVIAAVAAAAPAPRQSLMTTGASLAAAVGLSPAPTAIASEPNVAPTAPAPADIVEGVAALPQGSPFCGGEEADHTNISSDRNGRRSLTVKVSNGACRVELVADGRITFNDDFTDISALDNGGSFRLDVTDRGVRRQLQIESRNGSLVRTWRVDGREQPYDAAARAWFAAFLIELDRRTAIGVDVRLPHLLRQGGVGAVLPETARMTGDYARNEYYTRLARSARLTAAENASVLRQAAELTKSDHYATELLKVLADRDMTDPAQRAAVIEMIDRLDSDHYRAQAIEMLIGSGRPSADDMALLIRMLPRMKSDHYKTQVLMRMFDRAALTPEQQAAVARVAGDMDNEHYVAETLRRLAGTGSLAPQVRRAFLESVAQLRNDHYSAEMLRTFMLSQRPLPASDVDAILRLMPSLQDHYRGEMLKVLLEMSDLSEPALLGIIDAARGMTDHYEAETLRKVLLHRSASERVRSAVLAAAEQLSDHYRDELRRSAGRGR